MTGGGESFVMNHSNSMNPHHLMELKTAHGANKTAFQDVPQIKIDKLDEPSEGKRANKKRARPRWEANNRPYILTYKNCIFSVFFSELPISQWYCNGTSINRTLRGNQKQFELR